MLLRFIGDKCGDNPPTLEMFGYSFHLGGDPVFIADEKTAQRLANNSHFETVAETHNPPLVGRGGADTALEMAAVLTPPTPRRRGRPRKNGDTHQS